MGRDSDSALTEAFRRRASARDLSPSASARRPVTSDVPARPLGICRVRTPLRVFRAHAVLTISDLLLVAVYAVPIAAAGEALCSHADTFEGLLRTEAHLAAIPSERNVAAIAGHGQITDNSPSKAEKG